MALRPALEIIRVFLTPTAAADSYAGFLLAVHLEDRALSLPRFAAALATSILVYWLGMAANDLFDLKKDAVRAPSRPLPSGRISSRAAVTLCVVLGLLALALGFLLETYLAVAALLAAVLAYDGGGKNLPIPGSGLMGLCRAGNFLLGAAAAVGEIEAVTKTPLAVGAAMLGLYVAGVTAASRLEDEAFDFGRLAGRSLLLFAVPLMLLAAAPGRPLAWANALLLVILVANALRSARSAAHKPGAPFHGAAVFVRQALAGIFFVDAGILLAFLPAGTSWAEAGGAAGVLYVLALVAWVWKRRWMRKGSVGS